MPLDAQLAPPLAATEVPAAGLGDWDGSAFGVAGAVPADGDADGSAPAVCVGS
jgi:hypothetical protein